MRGTRRQALGAMVGVALAEMFGVRSAKAQSLDAIAQAAANHGVSYDWLVATASCETGGTFDPSASNGVDHGLFQFKYSTFNAYCSGDPYNAYDAANCAAYMFSLGLCTHWCCSGCHPNPCDG